MDAKKTTDAQHFIIERLRGMVGGKQPYRTGVLVLSYPATESGQDCRIASGIVMAEATKESALDIVLLVRRLRGLADELEATVEEKLPIPDQALFSKE